MNIPNPKPESLSIRVAFDPNCLLIDKRWRTEGIVFGTIAGVAQQYGVKMTKEENCWVYSAPKLRLQLFAEKLHFSNVPYA